MNKFIYYSVRWFSMKLHMISAGWSDGRTRAYGDVAHLYRKQ